MNAFLHAPFDNICVCTCSINVGIVYMHSENNANELFVLVEPWSPVFPPVDKMHCHPHWGDYFHMYIICWWPAPPACVCAAAAARSIVANYGWFLGMLIGAVLICGGCVAMYLIHRWRKKDPRIQEKTRADRREKGAYRLPYMAQWWYIVCQNSTQWCHWEKNDQ